MFFVSWAQFFVGLLVFYLIFRNDFRAVSPLSDELQIYFPVCYLFLFFLFWVLCVCLELLALWQFQVTTRLERVRRPAEGWILPRFSLSGAEPPAAGLTCSALEATGNRIALPAAHLQRRQWQPTPVLLPGKSHGWRSLVGGSPWGR